MVNDSLGGFPIEFEKKGKVLKIRFFPKNPNAKHHPVLVLQLDGNDVKKLLEILS